MKSMMASLLAVSMVASASAADVTIYITGSTAYRANTYAAIAHLIVPGSLSVTHDGGVDTVNVSSSKFSSATHASIVGTLTNSGTLNGSTIQVLTSWSGSEAGIASLAKTNGVGALVQFISPTATTYPASVGSGNGDATLTFTVTNGGFASSDFNGALPAVSQYPDIAMCDTWNTASQFKPNAKYQGVVYSGLTEATGGAVGIVPFVWVCTTTTKGGAAISNISSQTARALYDGTGYLKLNALTGVATDTVSYVFALGRNPESGTRLSCFAEPGIGATAGTKQYMPVALGGLTNTDSGRITAANVFGGVSTLATWPSYTSAVTGNTVSAGNGGYDSGGELCKAVANSTSTLTVSSPSFTANNGAGVTATLVAYTGINDAKALVGSNDLNKLTYNGVELPLTGGVWDFSPIKTGKYTLWGYEHLYYRTTPGTNVAAYGDALAAQIRTADAQIILDSSVLVSRAADGGKVR